MTDNRPAQDVGRRNALLAGVIVLVMLVAGLWLVQRLASVGAVQDCVAAGGRDCGRAATPG